MTRDELINEIDKIVWKNCSPLYEEDIEGHTHTLKGNILCKEIADYIIKYRSEHCKELVEALKGVLQKQYSKDFIANEDCYMHVNYESVRKADQVLSKHV